MSTPSMYNKKIAHIERLIEKYKERIRVITKTKPYRLGNIGEETEIETLETVIEDLEELL